MASGLAPLSVGCAAHAANPEAVGCALGHIRRKVILIRGIFHGLDQRVIAVEADLILIRVGRCFPGRNRAIAAVIAVALPLETAHLQIEIASLALIRLIFQCRHGNHDRGGCLLLVGNRNSLDFDSVDRDIVLAQLFQGVILIRSADLDLHLRLVFCLPVAGRLIGHFNRLDLDEIRIHVAVHRDLAVSVRSLISFGDRAFQINGNASDLFQIIIGLCKRCHRHRRQHTGSKERNNHSG